MKRWLCRLPLVLALAGLGGCALPERPAPVRLYDLGAGQTEVTAAPAGPGLLVQVRAVPALEGHAMLYRLAYADQAQLHAYARARWAMPPAELLRQRVRQVLGARQPLLEPGEGAARLLRLELEEFSQRFETPERSAGTLRLRATLLRFTPAGEQIVAQRSLLLQHPAPSADATGGVRALAAASETAARELAQWLQTLR